MTDLCFLPARRVVDMLRRGEVAPGEVLDAALRRHAEVDGAVNALPTLCEDRARAAIDRLEAGESDAAGWLAGLPVAIKDLTDVAGVRTTRGSLAFADHVPARSDRVVETPERRGAVVFAKSNTPEFGAGANTFNEVFGKTRNPWDTRKTCGGSSGGSAVALTTGQAWLATGSDLGGSLRIPASFCSIVGLRPSPGRVARGPMPDPMDLLWTDGPMARDVGDLALMLDAMSGRHPEDPLSQDDPGETFQAAVAARRAPARIAWSGDLGLTRVAGEVRDICTAAAARLGELGGEIEAAQPDLSGGHKLFQTLRADNLGRGLGDLLETQRDKLKPEVIWNIEKGLALDPDEVAGAEAARDDLVRRTAAFFDTYDLLVCPTVIVPPFDVDTRYVTELEGHEFATYIDWLAITYLITLTQCPALSLPCGFTADGLPVGLQLIGKPRGEAGLLSAAALAEELFGLAGRVPIDPVTSP